MNEAMNATELADDRHLDVAVNEDETGTAAQLTPPAKFLDPETGDLRVDALMKSYAELERRMGAGDHLDKTRVRSEEDAQSADQLDLAPADWTYDDIDDATLDAEFDEEDPSEYGDVIHDNDVPNDPENYQITTNHPWLEPDAELNAILHEHGFSQDQAQVVYDLAHEHVLPLFEQLAGQIAALRGESLLRETFDSEDWETQAAQVKQWGEAALPPELYETLAATPAGISALHQMMQHGEPQFLNAAANASAMEENSLRRMMDDPRYWRDHDPDLVSRVQEGFASLYPD